MAASRTGTVNGVGNSARDEKFFFLNQLIYLFIYYFSARLTELKLSARTKNLHIIRPVDV